jgi:hypothetical protein
MPLRFYIDFMPEKIPDRTKDGIPPIIFLTVSIIFVLPFFLRWNYIGVGDWELFVTMAAVPAKTILYYGQFPFWNPYLGGGNILFHHPEVGILSPFFLLILLFGPIAGIKLKMMFAYFLGFWGSYLFARRLGISVIASYLVSFAYFGSSYFALHFSIGHVPFTHFCFLPWFVYFLLRIDDNWKYVFGSALAVGLIVVGNGAAVPFLYTIFFSGLFILLYSFGQGKFRYVKGYIFSVIVGLMLASVKFIPMYRYLSQSKWEGMPDDFTPPGLLLNAFFSFNQAIFRHVHPDQYWGWHEYSAYISPLVILLAAAGAVFSFKKCHIWLFIAIFFLIFGLGHFSDISIWNLALHIPGFSSIRSPARAFQFVILAVAVMSAFGLEAISSRLKSSGLSKVLLPILVVALIPVINFFVNLPALKTIAYKSPEKVHFNRDFRHVIGNKHDIYKLFQQNRGSLTAPWLSAYRESRALVTADNEVAMEYVSQGRLRVMSREYTPNRVEYDITPSSGGMIIFGIGHDEGWSAADDRELFETNGLVSVRFHPADRHIALTYRPKFLVLGIIVSILSICGCLLFFFNADLGKRLEAILK